MQRTIENCTLHSIYVKNDYFYKKIKDSHSGGELDLSIDDYFNKVQQSVAELKDVSVGHVTIHVLPESKNDKSSSDTEDVTDDIIGTTSCDFHFEGDQVGMFEWENTVSDNKYDKKSISTLLDKIKLIYVGDNELGATVSKYGDSADIKVKTKSVTTEDGLEGITLDFASNFEYEIAELNYELKHGKHVSSLLDSAMITKGSSAKEMLEKLIEDLKQKNENTLLESSASSQRLGFVLKELQN